MLVLTQFSVGAFLAELALERLLSPAMISAIRPLHSLNALVFGLLALCASTLHLGRPQYAWRAVIGLRHSWLSREIVSFGIFAGAAVLYAAGNWFGLEALGVSANLGTGIAWTVATSGLVGVFCSVMIYAFTQKAFWSFPLTATRFFLTMAVLGIAAVWLTLLLMSSIGNEQVNDIIARRGELICKALMLSAALKLAFEASIFRHLLPKQTTVMKRSAMLMTGPLKRVTIWRFVSGLFGGIVMPVVMLRLISGTSSSQTMILGSAAVLFVASLVGELLERYLFFAAVASPRMPGTLR
jgi:formate dehydrogenase iron-sulfur subunit